MAAADLLALLKLHEVDAAIADVRHRAAALDPGREIMLAIKRLEAALAEAKAEADGLGGELKDKELLDRQLEEKLKRLDKDLYGGQVVNPREIEGIEKEMAAIKDQRERLAERVLELYELAPPARDKVGRIEEAITGKQKELKAHQREVSAMQTRLQEEFAKLAAARPAAAKGVPAGLLAQYETIRKRVGGVAVSEVRERDANCARCGVAIPEKVLALVREDRIATCESCHRIFIRVNL